MTLYRQILLLMGNRSVPYDYCVLSPRQRGLLNELIIPLKLGLIVSCGVRENKGGKSSGPPRRNPTIPPTLGE